MIFSYPENIHKESFQRQSSIQTEMALLGNITMEVGMTLQWDGPNMKITNDDAANKDLC